MPPAGLPSWDKISLLSNLYIYFKEAGLNKIAFDLRICLIWQGYCICALIS